MGWTSYIANCYKPNGKVDVKKECDSIFEWKGETKEFHVVKSSVKGSVYYAAVEINDVIAQKRNVVAIICLTSLDRSDGMNFGYKDMDETEIPCYYDCPKTILNLLTPTDNEYANEWRKRCWEKHSKPKLSDLPIGTMIKFTDWQGKEHKIYKHAPAYQFKRPFWMCEGNNGYYKANHIPDNWEVVTE